MAIADLNGDGAKDIVAGNWGLNSKYQKLGTIRLYYDDFDKNGVVDLIEAYYLGKWVPLRDLDSLSASIPSLREKFASFRAFGEAGIDQILPRKDVSFLEAKFFRTAVFLNESGRFVEKLLPIEAQFSPVRDIVIADFNGDGKRDLFLAQNFFGVDIETSRYSEGPGLVLEGNVDGTFRALSPLQSGIQLFGEQVKCELIGGRDLRITEAHGLISTFSPTVSRSD